MGKRSSPDRDYLAATERAQFVHLRLAQARKRGKPFDPQTVITRAQLDWARKLRRERKIAAKTVSLDSLLHEPAVVPDQMETLMSQAEVSFLLCVITPQQRDAIVGTFLAQLTRREVAELLQVSPKAVTDIKRRALETMRLIASK